jgi:hypothetical protein
MIRWLASLEAEASMFLLRKMNLSPLQQNLKNPADVGDGINVIVQKPIEI